MTTLNPALLVATATAFIGVTEEGPDNHGQMVERFLSEVGRPPGEPWCAAFVSHVGHWSHFDHAKRRSLWPLPRTASCALLGKFAGAHSVLVTDPEPGDVFLRYSPTRRRFAHTGIVVNVLRREERVTLPDGTSVEPAVHCMTIEGNTNEDGSEKGRTTLLRPRRLDPVTGDRFIRWVSLTGGAS